MKHKYSVKRFNKQLVEKGYLAGVFSRTSYSGKKVFDFGLLGLEREGWLVFGGQAAQNFINSLPEIK